MATREFSLFREEVRRAWHELRGGELSPARGAAAVALGLFIGSQPIFGCHTPLVLALCVWFRLDAAIAWVASNISNPFFAPFLMTAEWQLGTYLRTGTIPDPAYARAAGFSHIAGSTFLGAPVVGLGLAVVGALVTFGGIRVKRRILPGGGAHRPAPYVLPDHAPPWIKAVEGLAGRYAQEYDTNPTHRTHFHYVRVKMVTDPVARMIADVAGEKDGVLGEVLDIGTGRGQLPILLLELSRATKVRGLDWDAEKIAEANRAASEHRGVDGLPKAGLDAHFERGDARTAELGQADTALLIDVIHYFTVEEQDAILRRAAAAVRPGGRVVVREADTERGLRSFMTLLEERVFTTLRFNKGERVKSGRRGRSRTCCAAKASSARQSPRGGRRRSPTC